MYEWIMIFFVRYLYIIITLTALYYFFTRRRVIRLGVVIQVSFVAFGLAFLVDKILNRIIYSPRPFVVENVVPLISHAADNGFPSEHTLFVLLIAGVAFIFSKKMGIILGVLALGVGVGSVFVKVHHPIDIFGSMVIAFFSVWMSHYFIFRHLRKAKIVAI